MPLPERARAQARAKLLRHAEKLVDAIRNPLIPDNLCATRAVLLEKAARRLDPHAIAEYHAAQWDHEARVYLGVCAWDPMCDADAAPEDTLCQAHRAEQDAINAKLDRLIDDVAKGVS